jgi:hypothetical protein
VFRSCFASANIVTILARITRAPATTTSKSERDKKRAVGKTKKQSDHATHPQDSATAWHCSRAAVSPPWRPPGVCL